MTKCIAGVILGLAVLAADPAAAGAAIIDDFSTDTSGNYVATQYVGSGGTFAVTQGVLRISTGQSNTLAVVSDVHFATAGNRYGIDTAGLATFFVSTEARV